MSERKQWLDLAKGIGICSVIVYHASEGIKNSFPENSSFIMKTADYFSLWLMPMFFIVSGMLTYNSISKNNKEKIVSKIKDWVYIYLVWSLIIYITRLSLNSVTNTNMSATEILYIIWDPVPTIWFIYALLLSFCIMWLVHKMPSKVVLPLALFANLINAHFSGWFEHSIFERIAWIFFFYALGYYCHSQIIKAIEQSKINMFLALCFIMLTIVYWQVDVIIPYYFKPVFTCFITFLFLHLCYFIYKIRFAKPISNFINYIGSISMFIYLTHFPIPAAVRVLLVKLEIYNDYLTLIIAVITGVIVGMAAHYLSQNTKLKILFSRPINK